MLFFHVTADRPSVHAFALSAFFVDVQLVYMRPGAGHGLSHQGCNGVAENRGEPVHDAHAPSE